MASVILIPLLFGIIGFGFAFTQKLTLTSAVRDGARFGSVGLYVAQTGTPRTCGDVLTQTRNGAQTIGMTSGKVSVTVSRAGTEVCKVTANANGTSTSSGALTQSPCKGAGSNDNLSVKATFPGKITIPLVMTKNVTLTSTGVYRCEYDS